MTTLRERGFSDTVKNIFFYLSIFVLFALGEVASYVELRSVGYNTPELIAIQILPYVLIITGILLDWLYRKISVRLNKGG